MDLGREWSDAGESHHRDEWPTYDSELGICKEKRNCDYRVFLNHFLPDDDAFFPSANIIPTNCIRPLVVPISQRGLGFEP